MTLIDTMRKVSNREFLTWKEWYKQLWNNPSLTDMYLMQVAAEIRRSVVKKPKDVKTSDFQLVFKFASDSDEPPVEEQSQWSEEDRPPGPLTAEQISLIQMQMWARRLGTTVPDHVKQ